MRTSPRTCQVVDVCSVRTSPRTYRVVKSCSARTSIHKIGIRLSLTDIPTLCRSAWCVCGIE